MAVDTNIWLGADESVRVRRVADTLYIVTRHDLETGRGCYFSGLVKLDEAETIVREMLRSLNGAGSDNGDSEPAARHG